MLIRLWQTIRGNITREKRRSNSRRKKKKKLRKRLRRRPRELDRKSLGNSRQEANLHLAMAISLISSTQFHILDNSFLDSSNSTVSSQDTPCLILNRDNVSLNKAILRASSRSTSPSTRLTPIGLPSTSEHPNSKNSNLFHNGDKLKLAQFINDC